MGKFVDYHCKRCNTEMTDIPVGRGRQPTPYLSLFRCRACKTVGSTWITPGETPRCGTCYEEGVELLPDDATFITCPRCGEQGKFTVKEGSWE